MKEHLHLFTRVDLFTPVLGVKYLVIVSYNGNTWETFAKYDNWGSLHYWNILDGVSYMGKGPVITHVLDVSALTTKERAIEAALSFDPVMNHEKFISVL